MYPLGNDSVFSYVKIKKFDFIKLFPTCPCLNNIRTKEEGKENEKYSCLFLG